MWLRTESSTANNLTQLLACRCPWTAPSATASPARVSRKPPSAQSHLVSATTVAIHHLWTVPSLQSPSNLPWIDTFSCSPPVCLPVLMLVLSVPLWVVIYFIRRLWLTKRDHKRAQAKLLKKKQAEHGSAGASRDASDDAMEEGKAVTCMTAVTKGGVAAATGRPGSPATSTAQAAGRKLPKQAVAEGLVSNLILSLTNTGPRGGGANCSSSSEEDDDEASRRERREQRRLAKERAAREAAEREAEATMVQQPQQRAEPGEGVVPAGAASPAFSGGASSSRKGAPGEVVEGGATGAGPSQASTSRKAHAGRARAHISFQAVQGEGAEDGAIEGVEGQGEQGLQSPKHTRAPKQGHKYSSAEMANRADIPLRAYLAHRCTVTAISIIFVLYPDVCTQLLRWVLWGSFDKLACCPGHPGASRCSPEDAKVKNLVIYHACYAVSSPAPWSMTTPPPSPTGTTCWPRAACGASTMTSTATRCVFDKAELPDPPPCPMTSYHTTLFNLTFLPPSRCPCRSGAAPGAGAGPWGAWPLLLLPGDAPHQLPLPAQPGTQPEGRGLLLLIQVRGGSCSLNAWP